MPGVISLAGSVAALILVVGCTSAPGGGAVDGTAPPSAPVTEAPTTPGATATSEPSATAEPTDTPNPTASPLPDPDPTPAGTDPPLNAPGSVMSIEIQHESDAGLGDPGIVGSGHTVISWFTGDLVRQSNGTWRGTVTAESAGSAYVVFLTEECETRWNGEQPMEITARPGSYPDGNNFQLSFKPLAPPTYSEAPDAECDVPEQLNGIYYMPFHDTGITGGLVELKIADPPGGEVIFEDSLGDTVSHRWRTVVEYR